MSAVPLLLLGGAAVLLLGGKKKKKGPSEDTVDSGTFPSGREWEIVHIVGKGYVIDVPFENGKWVMLSNSGMTMLFPSKSEAHKAIEKISSGELVVDESGRVSKAY